MFQNRLLLLALGLMTVSSSTLAQNCPPAEVLAPCTCDEERMRFHCSGQRDATIDLKEIFERVSPLVGEDVIFDDILITSLPFNYTHLPANTMGSLKFRQIGFEYTKLETIHPDAFNGSYELATQFYMFDNRISNADNPTSFFDVINRFTKLEQLDITEWNVKTIPDDPFVHMPSLTVLDLSFWGLERIGSRVLVNLPNLVDARIGVSGMGLDGYAVDAFEGIGPNVMLNLGGNPLDGLDEPVFKTVMDTAAGLRMGGVQCPIFPYCSNILFNCDEKAAWLCGNVPLYEPKLTGFYCKTGGTNYDVFDWCRANNAKY